MSLPTTSTLETPAINQQAKIALSVILQGKPTTINVVIDDDYKELQTSVMDGLKRHKEEETAAKTPEQLVIENSLRTVIQAIGAGMKVFDEQLLALQTPDESGTCELFRQTSLVRTLYDDWCNKQGGFAAADTTEAQSAAQDARAEIDASKAPLFITHTHQAVDESTEEDTTWQAAKVIDLREPNLSKMIDDNLVGALTAMKLYSNAVRFLILQKRFVTGDCTALVELHVHYAVEHEYNTGMANASDPEDALIFDNKNVDKYAVKVLRVVPSTRLLITAAKGTPKETIAKEAALKEERFHMAFDLYAEQRKRARNIAFHHQLPTYVHGAIALFAQQLAELFDPTGVKVPEGIIVHVDVCGGKLDFDHSFLFTHSKMRLMLKDSYDDLVDLQKKQKATTDAADKKQFAVIWQNRFETHMHLKTIDNIVLGSNPRNQIVFWFTDIGCGQDFGKDMNAQFAHTIDVAALIARTKHMQQKEAAALGIEPTAAGAAEIATLAAATAAAAAEASAAAESATA